MKKKLSCFLCFLLTLVFVLSALIIPSAAADGSLAGSGQRKDPYLIQSVEDLCTFRDMVNGGKDFSGQFILQACDLDLSSIENWTPIGEYASGKYFKGTYNGGGHSISNLTIKSDTNVGFFGVLGGIVMNLGIESGDISGFCVGSIAGHSTGTGARILNCYSLASITATLRAGGIADNLAGGQIAHCFNGGTLTLVNEKTKGAAVGGIVSYNTAIIYSCTSFGTAPIAAATFSGYQSYSSLMSIEEMDIDARKADFASQVNEYASYIAQLMETLEGEGTEDSPYLINNAEEFCRFRDIVNMGAAFSNKWFRQTADIDLIDVDNWIPIGKYGSGRYFYGVYDGGGHSISNLNSKPITESANDANVGLFGMLAGTVMNLGIESGHIEGVCVGAITSHGSGTLPIIVNCYNKATVVGQSRAGGIADNLSGGLIVNCLNTGEISAPTAGGICSYGAKRIINSYSVGIDVRPSGAVGIAESSCKTVSSLDEAIDGLNKGLYNSANRTDYQHNNLFKLNSDGSFGGEHNYLLRFVIQEILIALAVFGAGLLLWFLYKTYRCRGSLRNGAMRETLVIEGGNLFGDKNARIKSIISLGFIFAFGMLLVAFLNADNTIIRSFFYTDSQDAFMDFFNPMQSVLNNNYEQTGYYTNVEGTYPPIARLIFWLAGQMIPTSTQLLSAKSIKADYGTLLVFFIFALCLIALMFVYRSIQGSGKTLLPIFAVLCSPMMFLVDRGNILIIVLVLSAIFVAGYRSKNPIVRHISYICLAIAAAIKIYPAILGLLLVREKKWKEVVICVIYGVAFCFLPFLFIGGFDELQLYVRNIGSTFGKHAVAVDNTLLNYTNVWADWGENILNNADIGRTIAKYTLYPFTLLLAGCALISKTWWKAVLAACMIMVLFPGFSIYYCGAFFALAMICFVSEEHTRKIDYAYAVFFMLLLIPLQFLCGAIGFTQSEIYGFAGTLGVIFAIMLIVDCVITLIHQIRCKKAEKALA